MFGSVKFSDEDLLAAMVGNFVGSETVVCGIPGNSLILATELSRRLSTPLELIAVKHLPGLGSVTESFDFAADPMYRSGVSLEKSWEAVAQAAEMAKQIRSDVFGFHKPVDLQSKTVVLAVESDAHTSLFRAVISEIRGRLASRVVVAAHTISASTRKCLNELADEVVVLRESFTQPPLGTYFDDEPIGSIGSWIGRYSAF